MYEFWLTFRYLMMWFSLVDACTTLDLFCVKWMRSTPYFLEFTVFFVVPFSQS